MADIRLDFVLMDQMITVFRGNAVQIETIVTHLTVVLTQIDKKLTDTALDDDVKLNLQSLRERILELIIPIAHQLEEKFDELTSLSRVTQAYEKSKRAQQDAFTLFRDMYRLWRFYKAKGSWVKVFNPIGFAITVGLLSKMFVKIPKVLVNATKGGFRRVTKQIAALLEYQMDNPQAEEPMDEEYISFITEMLVCGTAVGKVMWDYKPAKKTEIDPQTGEIITFEDTGFDDPIFEHIPIQNFYIDPGAKTISDAKYVIYEKYCTKEYITKKQEQGYYRDVDVEAGTNKSDRTGIDTARGIGGKGSTSEKYKDKIHLLEYWEDDRLIVIANSAVVLKDDDNPYNHGKKPFIAMQYVKVPHEFYGIGVLEPIDDLHKAVNLSLTQRLEYVSNLLTQQFAVISGRKVDEDAIIDGYPIVHVDSADAVIPLNKGSVPQAAFVSGSELIAEIERGTGFSGYAGGGTSSEQDKTKGTATGVSLIIQEAQTRFDLTLKRFEKVVLKKIAYMFLDLDKQHLSETDAKVINISGEPLEIERDLLYVSDWQIEIVPGSVGFIDKQQKYQNFISWVEFANAMIPNFNRSAAVMEAAEYQEIEESERIVIPMEVYGQASGGAENIPRGSPIEQGMGDSQGMVGSERPVGY